jgi:hypothetical protein
MKRTSIGKRDITLLVIIVPEVDRMFTKVDRMFPEVD